MRLIWALLNLMHSSHGFPSEVSSWCLKGQLGYVSTERLRFLATFRVAGRFSLIGKQGGIRSDWNLDQNVGLNVRIRVVALQASPYIARLYANDGILPGGIIRLSPEDLDSNQSFFKQIAVATDLLFYNVLKELLAVLGWFGNAD